ncbi:HAD-IA family hydrolase [Sphingobium sp. CR28]|uniref:HAD-IA family hydrolase n=1 Tax=Sphingobium sp. CR28 TaxID=3400272 RepID=UPI003FF0AD4A
MFDLVGFDLDGTLADTAADVAHATNHALSLADIPPLPIETIKRFVGGGARLTLLRALRNTGHDEAMVDTLLPHLIDHYAAHIADHSLPYPGVEETLDQLVAAGARLAICTNKREGLARLLIDALGWQDRFVAIVGGDSVGILKPDPAPLAAMIERAGGGTTLFVGDSDNDTRAAQALGIPVVLFTSGYGEPFDPSSLRADAVMSSFDALPALARNLFDR